MMMNTNKFLRIIFLLLPLLACACADNTFLDDNGRVVEGLPAQLRLKFEVKDSPVLTRAEQAAVYENRVENVYVFIFGTDGKVLNRLFCTPGKGLSYADGDTNHDSGYLTISTESMNDVTVVGIANVTYESTATAYSVTEADLNAVADRTGLAQLVARMEVATVSRGSTFMMTGYVKDGESTSINIPEGTTSQTFPLVLERLDAKVKFVVEAKVPDGKTWTNFNFQPKEWRVLRVPRQSYLLEAENGGDYDGEDAGYFDTEYVVFEDKSTESTGGGSFAFYMPENRKTYKTRIDVAADAMEKQVKEAYALREKREKTPHTDPVKPGQTVQDGVFVYANDNSTYVEMTGVLSYNATAADGQVYNINADVKLTVHLGYAVLAGSGAKPDVNDYETLRNGSYTYHVTIMGIDNIIVEVTNADKTSPEPRPGYEGSVSYAEEKVFELDAHYERCLLQFPVSYISPDLTWGVETPFSSGVNPAASGEVAQGLEDYKWVKFAINREYGVTDPDKYVKYPGDLNYKGGEDKPSPYYNGGGGGSDINARLLDVKQLIERLKEYKAENNLEKLTNTDGTITITAFIDEYLYFRHPQRPETDNLLLWKDCVGKNDRLLHIIPSELRYSPDGNSSIVNTIYTFKQKPIQTVYNVDNPNLETAWGLESVMEGDRLLVDETMSQAANDMNNGRFNTWTYFNSKQTEANPLRWTDILDVSEETGKHQLKDGYQNVFFATLLRNRDLDGDNIVDQNEIRWYLASINQLTDIYLGEYALDNDIRLYPYNPKEGNYPPNGKTNSVFWHYASSTYHGTSDNIRYPFVLWAQVGVGKGNYITSNEQNGKYYAYRCIRNLGIALDDLTTNPTDLVIYDEAERTFDLSYMNPKAIRTYYVAGSGTYPAHNERSSNNLPYKKFQVSEDRRPASSNQNWDYFQTTNPFVTDGYRVPNMRELLIFTSRMNGLPSEGMILSYTGFSMRNFGPYGDDRKGYQFNLKDKSMGAGGDYGKVYGVRDLNE